MPSPYDTSREWRDGTLKWRTKVKDERSGMKFYFQISHDVDEDGNCGKVIEITAGTKFDAWRRMVV